MNEDAHVLSIVPAHPGWHVLEPVEDENRKVVALYPIPVVAWRVDSTEHANGRLSTLVWPVGIEDVEEGWALRGPDGRIVIAGEQPFGSEDELLAHLNAEQRVTSS